jgi:hypothetical protein
MAQPRGPLPGNRFELQVPFPEDGSEAARARAGLYERMMVYVVRRYGDFSVAEDALSG